MLDTIIWIILIVLSVCSVVWAIYERHNVEIARTIAERAVRERIQEALDKQRAVVKGQVAEQMYPVLPACPFLPSDMRFIGNPIDFVVFDGYTDTKDGSGSIKEVVFVECKTGASRLSPHQRAIRDAINEGRVRWETVSL